MSKNTYILDPGHGGINPTTKQYVTPGKRSPKLNDGSVYFEGVGNRQVSKRVADKLKPLGIKFAYTVTPDEWQDVSLPTRVARANALHAKTPCVLISIHSNAAGDGKNWHAGEGYEVFTSHGQTKSDEYATIWFDEMRKEFPTMKGRSDMRDGDVDKEANYTMITSTRCPAFLIEMAFHTHLKEVELLRTASGQERFANVIVRTIQRIENGTA
jgi:N-acetylmuramoyl-L-alanine amidase